MLDHDRSLLLRSVRGQLSGQVTELSDLRPPLERRTLVGFSILFIIYFVFPYRVSLYSLGCPGIHSVDQIACELGDLPACLLSAGIKGVSHHHLAGFSIF